MFKIQCDGKIFLFGEYACLAGGPAILHTFPPSYELHLAKNSDGSATLPEFNTASPAGMYLESVKNDFKGWSLRWIEPESLLKGTGSSSAQFLLLMQAHALVCDQHKPSLKQVLEKYWSIVGESQGIRPSGADIAAQYTGNGTVFVKSDFASNPGFQGFTDAVFVAVNTGAKVRTHDHLRALKEADFMNSQSDLLTELNEITQSAHAFMLNNDARAVGSLMNDYQAVLNRMNLADQAFKDRVAGLSALNGVLGAKGSGAQGGDCVLILVQREKLESVLEASRFSGFQTATLI